MTLGSGPGKRGSRTRTPAIKGNVMISKRTNSLLKKCCPNLDDYKAGKMGVDNYGHDCSCGCYYFLNLEGSGDWGVCCNPDSPRAGLLTWEHQGCAGHFKRERFG